MKVNLKVTKLLLLMLFAQLLLAPQAQLAQTDQQSKKRTNLKKVLTPYGQVNPYARLKNQRADKKLVGNNPYRRLLDPLVYDQLSSAGKRAARIADQQLTSGNLRKPERQQLAKISNLTSPVLPNKLAHQVAGSFNSNILVNDPTRDPTALTQSESSIAAKDNNVIVSFNDINEGSGYSFSTNGGQTFSQSAIPDPSDGLNLGDGVLSFGPNGELYYATLTLLFTDTGIKSIIGVARSTDNGATFSAPIDASTTAGNNIDFQDKEWLTVDNNANSPFKGNVYVSWTNFSINGVDINFARSIDNGASYQTPINLSKGVDSAGVQGSMPVVAPNGDLYVAYYRIGGESENFVPALAITKSTDGGKTFSRPKNIATIFNTLTLSGGTNGFGVRTNSFPNMTVDQNGAVHIVYAATNARNSSPTGIDRSDIFYLRSTNGGQTFSTPVKLNDDLTSTSQSNPSIAIAADGTIGVRWWDRRNDPIFDSLTDVFMAVSTNGGVSFSSNFQVSDHNWVFGMIEPEASVAYHGDYDTITTLGNEFYVAWSDERNENADVFFTRVPTNFNPQTPDFTLSTKNQYGIVIAGQQTTAALQLTDRNGFADNIGFSATSNAPGLSFTFAPATARAGQAVTMTIRAGSSVAPGTYMVTVAASSGQKTRRSNMRLTVFPSNHQVGLPRNITNNRGESNLSLPGFQVDARGTIHVGFVDNTNLKVTKDTFIEFTGDSFYMQSTDGGRTFSKPVSFLTQSRNITVAGAPVLAIDNNSGAIYIGFAGFIQVDNSFFLVKSTDGGRTFSAAVKVFDETNLNDCIAEKVSMQVDSTGNLVFGLNTAFCFVEDENEDFTDRPAVFVIRSNDQGKTFTEPVRISAMGEVPIFGGYLRLTLDTQGTAYLAYTYFQASADFSQVDLGIKMATASRGKNFSKPVPVFINRDIFSIIENGSDILLVDTPYPGLAVQGDNVYVTFEAQRPPFQFPMRPDADVFLVKSTDKGQTFSKPINVSQDGNSALSGFTNVLVDSNGNVNVGWRSRNGFQLARSANQGQSFGRSVTLTGNTGVFTGTFDTLGLTTDANRNLLAFWNSGISAQFEIYICPIPLSSLGTKQQEFVVTGERGN